MLTNSNFKELSPREMIDTDGGIFPVIGVIIGGKAIVTFAKATVVAAQAGKKGVAVANGAATVASAAGTTGSFLTAIGR